VTALIAWPNFHSQERNGRSINRWQHRLKREHPTGTERKHRSSKSADGRLATVATRPEKNLIQPKDKGTHLTPTGLLMEGVYTNNPVNERNGDFSPTSRIVARGKVRE
jgi:hypothetical protein